MRKTEEKENKKKREIKEKNQEKMGRYEGRDKKEYE